MRLLAAGMLAATILGGAAKARAGYLGGTVDGAYYFPDTGTVYQDDGSKAVSPSAVFTFATGTPNTTVTVSDTEILASFDNTGSFTPASFNGFTITNVSGVGQIMGVSVDGVTDVAGFTAGDISYTSDSVSVNLQGLSIAEPSDVIGVDVVVCGEEANPSTPGSTPVPEPATFAPALLGAPLLAFWAWKKRRAKIA